MTIVDRLVALMDERNLKPAQITRELGISGSSSSMPFALKSMSLISVPSHIPLLLQFRITLDNRAD